VTRGTALAAVALAAAAGAGAAQDDLASKRARIGSGIEWLSDGHVMIDAESITRQLPEQKPVDRDALMAEARKRAAAANRLILWHVIRVPGRHMNRAYILDTYLQAAVFSDPDVAALVRNKFVPLRMASDRRLGVQTFDFVEPGFLFLTPEGEVVHRVDRIRTFSAPWTIHLLRAVLRKHPRYNAPAGEEVDALIDGGDYERALERRLDPTRKARALRLLRRADGAADAPPLERARLALHRGDFEAAEKALSTAEGREAEYLRSIVEFYTAREGEAAKRWRALAESGDDVWAWKGAANVVTERDTLPMGPTPHSFEDVVWHPDEAYAELPRDTRWPRSDAADAARRAVEFLLRNQRSNGGFEDSRYVYCPSPKILPNVFVAATALAAAALREWRSIDPARVDRAVERAEAYILNDANLAPGQNEECYAQAYRLLYLAKKGGAKERMNAIVRRLAEIQDERGFWAHEYPNPFCTAAAMHALWFAKGAGAEGAEPLMARGAAAIRSTRGDGGRQAYSARRAPSGAQDSMARSAMCEAALSMAGERAELEAALGDYWGHLEKLESVRVCDFHALGQLGGFFFFHGVFHTAIAAELSGERAAHRKRFREQLLRIPEIDGSFVDSHELGKCYGTAMALLVLKVASE
jgi:hypothetical protein